MNHITRKLNKKFTSSLIIGLAIMALVVTTLAFSPVSTVYAASGTTPTPGAPGSNPQVDQNLANQFKREQNFLTVQQTHMDKAKLIVPKLQDLINKAKQNGKDVSSLESALATFNTQIASAQAPHDTAAGILSTHTGFDDNGKVTDRQAARQTVLNARQSLLEAHLDIVQAVANLRLAIVSWRLANQPTPQASPSGSAS
jgi:hypothetical protein